VSLEAMSYGIPCILSNIAANREISGEGKWAVLFRSGDSNDLYAKIRMLLLSPDLLKEYGRRGRSIVAERYCPKAVRAKYYTMLNLPLERAGL
jgi:glycosyltransferase involved in cell wall biosynthesis